jgi:DNA-directed RNA polymerase sigma subunit (sigma70/sigma32)
MMSSLLAELDEKKVRTRLNQRKRAIHEQILQSLQKVVEAAPELTGHGLQLP